MCSNCFEHAPVATETVEQMGNGNSQEAARKRATFWNALPKDEILKQLAIAFVSKEMIFIDSIVATFIDAFGWIV